MTLKNNDPVEAATKIVKIANLLCSSYGDAADAIGVFLTKYYGDTGEIRKVCSTIKDIARNMKK